jgi:mannosyltransferase OCH1-like enzyme
MSKYIHILIVCIFIKLILYFYPFTQHKKIPFVKSPILTKDLHIKSINGIPLIIFRTHENIFVNSKMFELCHTKWVKLNPSYKVIWYTGKQRESFLQEFDINVYNAYKKLKPRAFKADLWRLCILYKYGGVYVDAQSTPYKCIDYIMKYTSKKNKYNFISALDCKQSGNGIHNGFIISSPRHPFLYQCIQDIILNINTKNYTDNILEVTGPLCLLKSIQKVTNKKNFCLGYNKCNYPFYLLKFEFGPSQYISDPANNIILLSKKYSFLVYLYEKILKRKTSYSFMWKNKDIYS